MGPTGRQRRTLRGVVAGAFVAALTLAASGCGGDEFANDPRPAPPIAVSVVITPRGVSVSPSHIGAGTIELLASNQTATSQRVRLRSGRLAPGARALDQATGPISPRGVATLKADLDEGSYVVSGGSAATAAARIVVGARRASAQNRILQP